MTNKDHSKKLEKYLSGRDRNRSFRSHKEGKNYHVTIKYKDDETREKKIILPESLVNASIETNSSDAKTRINEIIVRPGSK